MATATPTTPPARRRLVGVSTKMYFSYAQTQSYIASILQHLSSSSIPTTQIDIFIIPDHISLTTAVAQLRDTPILVGAQDSYYEDRGAYTGFTSPAVLAEVGCRIVELGHAERRRLLGETDNDAARKAAAAVRNGMVPLVCIGERTLAQTGEVIATAVAEVKPQVEAVLAAVPDDADIILAYEPVWAIGAPAPAAAEHVVGVVRGIRELDCVRRRGSGATTTRILYGGSAGPGLFTKLKDGGVDGLFLGRFAHDPEQFVTTIREVAEA